MECTDEALAEVIISECIQDGVDHAVSVAHERDDSVQVYHPGGEFRPVIGSESDEELEGPVGQPTHYEYQDNKSH